MSISVAQDRHPAPGTDPRRASVRPSDEQTLAPATARGGNSRRSWFCVGFFPVRDFKRAGYVPHVSAINTRRMLCSNHLLSLFKSLSVDFSWDAARIDDFSLFHANPPTHPRKLHGSPFSVDLKTSSDTTEPSPILATAKQVAIRGLGLAFGLGRSRKAEEGS